MYREPPLYCCYILVLVPELIEIIAGPTYLLPTVNPAFNKQTTGRGA